MGVDAPAAAVVWTRDTNDDRVIQLLELEMLAYDPANKRLCRYQPLGIITDEDVTPVQFRGDDLIKRALLDFTPTSLAPRIDAVRFYKSTAGRKAGALEAQIRVRNGTSMQVFTVACALRSGVDDTE